MKPLTRIAVVGVLVSGALGLSACGDDGSGVSASAAKHLDAQVEALRTTAADPRADRQTAAHQLALLRDSVNQLQSDGDLSESAATRIRRAADAVESQLTELPAPTTTTTTTTTIPPSEDDHGNGNGRDGDGDRKGKGKND